MALIAWYKAMCDCVNVLLELGHSPAANARAIRPILCSSESVWLWSEFLPEENSKLII